MFAFSDIVNFIFSEKDSPVMESSENIKWDYSYIVNIYQFYP